MRESSVGKTTRHAEDEGGGQADSYKSCKAARAAPNRIRRAKPKEAAHCDVDHRSNVAAPSPKGRKAVWH
jgi:hypothetical protein